jgi:hypothetical protein
VAQSPFGAPGIAQALKLVVVVLAIVSLGCRSVPAGEPIVQHEALRVATPPEWRPGDRWVYRWLNGTTTGTRTLEVVETREVSGTLYYVLRNADDELLNFWTVDLRWAFAVGARDSKVEARIDRPVPWFDWPLEVGRRWSHQGVYQDRGGKREANETFMVVGAETVEVPGGRFEALKIVREGQSVDSDQYWYAPDVRSYVKWILKRGDKRIEEELLEYKPVERLIPRPAKTTSTPK